MNIRWTTTSKNRGTIFFFIFGLPLSEKQGCPTLCMKESSDAPEPTSSTEIGPVNGGAHAPLEIDGGRRRNHTLCCVCFVCREEGDKTLWKRWGRDVVSVKRCRFMSFWCHSQNGVVSVTPTCHEACQLSFLVAPGGQKLPEVQVWVPECNFRDKYG